MTAFGPGNCSRCGVFRTSFKARHVCMEFTCDPGPLRPTYRPQRPSQNAASARLRLAIMAAAIFGGGR